MTEEATAIEGKSCVDEQPELVIVTGMSGAGRTEAMHVFEDMGYFCIDNLPSSLIKNLLQLHGMPGQDDASRKLAVVCDARNGEFFASLSEELQQLKKQKVDNRLLFLDASDEKLVARYKSSRRRHPLCDDGMTIGQGIQRERSLMFGLKEIADNVIDTTDLLPQQLRDKVRSLFSSDSARSVLNVTVYSFGFKHGHPSDADIVMDVRFLPNPYYDPELKHLTGLDKEVRDFVLYRSETEDFLKRWYDLLNSVMPGYVKEGKQQLAIAIGCTGGQHRSVALAEKTGDYLKTQGYRTSVAHRDLSLAEKAEVAG